MTAYTTEIQRQLGCQNKAVLKVIDAAGRPIESYADYALSEARDDVLAFGDVVAWGKNRFELEGQDLESFVRKILEVLIHSGAKVIRPIEKTDGYDWEPIPRYALKDVPTLVSLLIEDSKTSDDELQFFAWFSFNVPANRWPKIHITDGRVWTKKPRGDA